MGKIELALNLAKRTQNYLKATGKSSILMTKPQAISRLQLEGLRLASPLRSDVCAIPKDPSLAPELLDDLLKVRGTQLEKVEQIKNRFLRAMGYKNPELIRCENSVSGPDLSADFCDGVISCTTEKCPSMERLVALVRHELDHLDKFAKLVKAEGVDAAEASLMKGILKRYSYTKKTFDRNFWLNFSKDADITNFDSKKYLEALENYEYRVSNGFCKTSVYDFFNTYHRYCTNELERSGYEYTKKVLRCYGVDDTVMADFYGEPFGKIKNLLKIFQEKRAILEPKGFKGAATFDQLYTYAVARTTPQGVEHLKYIRDIINGKVVPNEELFQKCITDLNAIEDALVKKDKNAYLKVLDTVYDWLKQEKFTINDIDFC